MCSWEAGLASCSVDAALGWGGSPGGRARFTGSKSRSKAYWSVENPLLAHSAPCTPGGCHPSMPVRLTAGRGDSMAIPFQNGSRTMDTNMSFLLQVWGRHLRWAEPGHMTLCHPPGSLPKGSWLPNERLSSPASLGDSPKQSLTCQSWGLPSSSLPLIFLSSSHSSHTSVSPSPHLSLAS